MREKRIIWKSTNKGYIRIASDSLGRSALAKIIRKVKIDTNWLEQGKRNHVKLGEDLAQERPTVIGYLIDGWMEAKATAPLYKWKPKHQTSVWVSSYEFINYRKRGD
ncbi:MAG: hypothetical protein PHY47_19515 [Lachnospiraceae bacterium]|nr:hypothetical protein [Lachnospiraceae bacterium]